MKKTVATPVRLQKPASRLSKKEKTELKNFGDKTLSAQEIADRGAEEAAHVNEKPVRDWRDSVDAIRFNSDDVENIIDAMNPSDRARLDKVTKDKYNDKKALRTQKPAGAP